MIFRNDRHKSIFEREIQLHEGCGKEITAALFLLTADNQLWRQTEKCVGTRSVDVTAMKPRNLDGTAYAYFIVAKDILTGKQTVSIMELADRSLMPSRLFMLISTALLIKGYGLETAKRVNMDTAQKGESK